MKKNLLFAALWLGLGSLFLWQLGAITEITGLNQYVALAIGVAILLPGLFLGARAFFK